MTEALQEHLRVRDPNPDVTAPQLVVEISFEVSVEQHVDIVKYFASFGERRQDEFARFVENMGPQGYVDYELPGNFLFPQEDDGMDIDGMPQWRPGVADPMRVDPTGEFDLRVRLREGATAPNYGRAESDFTPEDFVYLRRHVAWLDKFFKAREAA